VHAELATRDDKNAVLDTSDVNGAGDLTACDQRILDVLEIERGKGRACGCRREVNHAVLQVRDGA
jgi:hypothetical protein